MGANGDCRNSRGQLSLFQSGRRQNFMLDEIMDTQGPSRHEAMGFSHEDAAMVTNVDFRSSRFRRLLRQVGIYVTIIYRVNWLAMFTFARFEIVQKHAGRVRWRGSLAPQSAAQSVVLKTGLPAQEIVRRVRDDGIATELCLSEDAVADVMLFAASARCYGNGERHCLLDRSPCGCLIPGNAVVGDYLDGIADCDTIRRIWRDPEILAIARGSLGTCPLPLRSRLWWSFRSDRATAVMRAVHSQDSFHFDLDDWRAVKFFFYMTDVGPENGPHIYVRGSHRKRAMLDQLSPFKVDRADILPRNMVETISL